MSEPPRAPSWAVAPTRLARSARHDHEVRRSRGVKTARRGRARRRGRIGALSRGPPGGGRARDRGRVHASRPRRGVRRSLSGVEQRRQDPRADPRPRRDRRRARRLGRGDHRRPGNVPRGGVRRRAAPRADRRGQRPARRRGRLEPPARRDVLGRQRGPGHVRHQRHRHGALGHRGQGRGRPAVPPARRQAAGPPPGLRLDHLRHARPRPGRPRVPRLRRRGLPLREGRLGARPLHRLRERRAARSGDRPRRPRRDRARRPHDRRRRGAHGLGLEPRHPDVPGDRRRRPPLLVRGPAGRAGPRRVPAAPRRRRHSHLHRGEGLARRALPRPDRVRARSTSS